MVEVKHTRAAIDTRPLQYTAIIMFALLGALFCVSAYSGAAESKRLNRVNQENIAWQK